MNSGPRIVHITAAWRSGGALYVFELATAVQKAGCPVDFVCPTEFDDLSAVRKSIAGQTILPGSVTLKRYGLKTGLLFWPARACRAIQDASLQAKTAHLNFPCPDVLVAPFIKRLKRLGFDVVFTVHDPIPHNWLGKVSKLRWSYWYTRASYRAAHVLVVHNDDARSLLGRHFQVPDEKIRVIPLGSFKLTASPAPYREEREFIALMVGTLRANKGIDLAVRAIQALRAGGQPIRLVIAGGRGRDDISKRRWEECKALIAQSPDGIDVLERFIPDDELTELLARSHMILMPYTEFFSQSAVASLALSSERALISTDVGGLKEIVAHEDACIRIEAPTAEAVERALIKAMTEGHEKLRARGLAGRAVIDTHYSWDAIGRLSRKVYEELAARGKSGSA